jgi:hypothetical protein
MVTVPLLVTDSGLKGSNFPPSAFSASLSDFLSAPGVPGAAITIAGKVSASTKLMQAPNFNRLMFSPDEFLLLNRREV